MPLIGNLIAMDRRNATSDLLCMLNYWRRFDKVKIPESVFYDILNNGTHPEVIRRARQKYMEEQRKRYGVTSEVEKKRLALAAQTREEVKQKTLG